MSLSRLDRLTLGSLALTAAASFVILSAGSVLVALGAAAFGRIDTPMMYLDLFRMVDKQSSRPPATAVAPYFALLAVTFCMTLFRRQRVDRAVLAAGVSPLRFSRPFVLFATVAGGVGLAAQEDAFDDFLKRYSEPPLVGVIAAFVLAVNGFAYIYLKRRGHWRLQQVQVAVCFGVAAAVILLIPSPHRPSERNSRYQLDEELVERFIVEGRLAASAPPYRFYGSEWHGTRLKHVALRYVPLPGHHEHSIAAEWAILERERETEKLCVTLLKGVEAADGVITAFDRKEIILPPPTTLPGARPSVAGLVTLIRRHPSRVADLPRWQKDDPFDTKPLDPAQCTAYFDTRWSRWMARQTNAEIHCQLSRMVATPLLVLVYLLWVLRTCHGSVFRPAATIAAAHFMLMMIVRFEVYRGEWPSVIQWAPCAVYAVAVGVFLWRTSR